MSTPRLYAFAHWRDQADRCLEIYRQLPQRKGIFDSVNYVQCGDDTVRSWDLLKDYIHYLHIKDALSNGVVVLAGKGGPVALPQFQAGGMMFFRFGLHFFRCVV